MIAQRETNAPPRRPHLTRQRHGAGQRRVPVAIHAVYSRVADHVSCSYRPGNREQEGALFECADVVRDALVERKQPA